MSDEFIEGAKAVQEASKAVTTVTEASEKAGRFISKYTRESLEAGMGIFADKLKYIRWERQHRLCKKADEFLKREGFDKPLLPLPLKHAIPLIEAASLEENNEIQDLYAKLLVSASINERLNNNFLRSYIDTLERFTPKMANIFNKQYEHYFRNKDAFAANVNTDVTLPEDLSGGLALGEFSDDLELAWNELDRLGCLVATRNMNGGHLSLEIKATRYGIALYEAVTLKNS